MRITNKQEPIVQYLINRIDAKYPTKSTDGIRNNTVLMSAAAALALEAAALVKKSDKTE